MRTRALVPNFRFFCTTSEVMMDLYLSANLIKVSTSGKEQPVWRRSCVSSSVDMGIEVTGKNMLACSSESQSLRGTDLDAVAITRNELCGTESSPDAIYSMV